MRIQPLTMKPRRNPIMWISGNEVYDAERIVMPMI